MKFSLLLLLTFYFGYPQIEDKQSEQISVYIFFSEDCPICKYYIPEIKRISTKYSADNVSFTLVFPNFSSKHEDIQGFLQNNDADINYKTDYFKSLAKKYDIRKTPEVLVLNALDEMIYKGRIDNSYYSLGKRRRVVTDHNLVKLLTSINNKETFHQETTEAIGCFINFSDI